MTCTAASHDALKRTWADFEAGTRIGFSWHGLIVRHCVDCCSSLTMPECARCSCGCPVDDCVTTKNARGDEVTYHARCILERMAEKKRITFSERTVSP